MARHLITVGQENGCDHTTIGAALANARPGAVISVRPGSYRETLVVNNRVTIVADGPRGSVEIAPDKGAAVTLAADAVMLTDLLLRGGAGELPVIDAVRGQVALDGCEVLGAGWTALLSRGSGSLAIRSCRITNPVGAGVVEAGTTGSVIADCLIENLGTSGVVISEQGRADVRNCRIRHDAADTAVLPGIDGLGLLPLRGPTAPDAPAREPEPEGGPIGPAAWAEALTWLRLGLSVRILDEALGYLRDRVTGGSPLLSRQLIKGALADAVALQLQVRSVLDAHAPGDVPRPLSAGLNAMVTQADRILLPLLGASGFTTEGPGRVAHASELLVDTYFTIAQEGTEPC
ncbi:right-handed parallel beta-helix repeat-containing protein [Streptomyces olivaceoviridis]